MDQPSFAPLTLGTIPAKARKLFERALGESHALILSQIEEVEDTAQRGPSLQTEGGVLKVAVTLTVEMAVKLGDDDVSSVEVSYAVDTKRPRFKAVRSSALFRQSGFIVERDDEDAASAIPFPARKSRISE